MFTTQLKSKVFKTFKYTLTNTSLLPLQTQKAFTFSQPQRFIYTKSQQQFNELEKFLTNSEVSFDKDQNIDMKRGYMSRLLPYIWRAEDKKPPKGFEKFFKKKEEREAESKHDKKPESSKESETQKKEMNKESSQKEKEEEEHISEEEDGKDGKHDDKKGGSDSGNGQWQRYFFDQNGNPKPEGFLALLLSSGVVYSILTYKKPVQEIVYMDFLNNYLLKNNIKEIAITKDRRSEVFNYRADIITNSGEKFYMILGSYEQFLAKLDMVQREMGRQPAEFIPVKYTNQGEEQVSNLLLNLLIGGLFVLFFMQIYKNRNPGSGPGNAAKGGKNAGGQNKQGGGWFQGGGGMNDIFGYGKSNATVYGEEKKIKTRFKDVAGLENAKVEVMEFVDFLKNPKKYQKLGARVPRGALLVGPPGCGKTLLAKAVAGEAKVPFMSISGSDFVEMFVGVGASRVRDLFKKARSKAPSIVFIDEIDAVGKKRHGKFGGGNDERDNTLNQLLVEMDGFTTDTSVIVLAATNRADILDKALLRPGRFDRTIEITLPNIKERDEIFNVHLKKIKLNEKLPKEEYARKISALTPGFSGADIKNICNEAAIIAARKSLESVSIKEFEEATERVIGGIEKKLPLSEYERKTVAFHEAGHAVAGWFLEHSSPLLKVTIIPRAKGALGFAQYLPDELNLYTMNQLEDMIVMALGGRVSEEIFFGKITTGASDDIKKVTQIATGIVTEYGMSAAVGPLSYSVEEGFQKPFSDKTNKIIDQEVKKIIDRAYIRCKSLLTEKKDLVQKFGEALLQRETLALPDIVEVLGQRPYPLKSSILEYLQELTERKVEEEAAEHEKEQKQQDEKQAGEEAAEQEVIIEVEKKKDDSENKQQ